MIHERQFRILTETPSKGDRIIVCEKVDGACMAVVNLDGGIVPLTPDQDTGRGTPPTSTRSYSRCSSRSGMRAVS